MINFTFYRGSINRLVLTLLIILFSIQIAPGQNYWVKITNKTEHYLHVIVNNQSFLYIAPKGYIRESFPVRQIQVKVIYAPGQGISGKIERELEAQGESGPACEHNIFCNTVPYPNVAWEVVPGDFDEEMQ